MPNQNIGEYEIKDLIGIGAFGRVHKGIHNKTGEFVAVKLERITEDTSKLKLFDEAKFLKNLKKHCDNVPTIIRTGASQKWNFLIMEYLGANLDELFTYCKCHFSLKTTLMIGIEILQIIQNIHTTGIIHRDIKPDNFLIGYGPTHRKLYIIDFGLSKGFMNEKTLQHEKCNHLNQFTGSCRYSSIKNHKGFDQSRRDDSESIGYMLIHFMRGKLPWQGIIAKNKKEKLKKTFEIKYKTSIRELCQGLPKEFIDYMKYCRQLRYIEKPDYNYLINLFVKLMKKKRYIMDYKYDWDIIDTQKENMNTKLQNIKIIKIKKAAKHF